MSSSLPHHDHRLASDPETGPIRTVPSPVDDSRPFGAHLRMGWWVPIVLLIALPVVLITTQLRAFLVAGAIEGSADPLAPDLSPLKKLGVNLATGVTGLIAVGLLMWLARVPWRALFTAGRGFDRRRLVHYALGAAVLVAAGLGTVGVLFPESTSWTDFGITGTTLALLAITLLTTPIQAAGEELMYRSALLPAAASWIRAVRPALAVGLVVSAVGFTAVHGSTDPWLVTYFMVVAVSTGLMAVLSGGMEAPIAFHVVNNVLAGVVNSVLAGGGDVAVDRSTDTGDASLLILIAMNAGMVALVWAYERRRKA